MRYMLHSMRMLLKSATQYRASFVMQTIGQLVMTGGDLMAVLVLMNRFAHAGQWSGDEILMFFGVMQLSFALTECFGRGISSFSSLVGSGDFDSLLLRPRGLLLQTVCTRLDPRRWITAAVGLAALGAASARLGLAWTVGRIALLLFSVVGSVLLLLGLFLIEATACFFSIRSIEAVNVLTYGGRQTCQYPVDLYPGPLKTLFTWVAPFALCMHLPVSYLLGKPLFPVSPALVAASPLTGFAFFGLMTQAWRLGVRHYRSTGS